MRRTLLSVPVLLVGVLAGTADRTAPALPPDVARVVERIRCGPDMLGWGPLVLGTSLREVEAILGGGLGGSLVRDSEYARFGAEVILDGTPVRVAFSGRSPEATLQTIQLRFAAPQDPDALKLAVRTAAPDTVFWRGRHSRGDPPVTEAEEDLPNYVVPPSNTYVILVKPAYGVVYLSDVRTVD